MKEIKTKLCGNPNREYRPTVLLIENKNIRRSAENMANENNYTYGWIDNRGKVHDCAEGDYGTDLYMEVNSSYLQIENSCYRANR